MSIGCGAKTVGREVAMRLKCSVLLFALLPVPLAAQEGCFGAGQPLFHCQVGARAVDVCLQGEVLTYRFGPSRGAAEMLLARRAEDVGMTPWNGIGRYLWEEISVTNGAYAYTVHYSVDRLAQGDPQVTGGLLVTQSGRTLAELSCDAGSVRQYDFYPVFEAKERRGQCWSMDSFEWGRC